MRLILTGRFISDFMTAMFGFVKALYVLDLTNSSVAFSMVVIASILPRALLNFFTGIAVDRYDLKLTIVATDVFAGVLILGFFGAFQFFPQSIVLFICLNLSMNVLNTIFGVATQTAMPRIVGENLLMRCNAISQSMKAIIQIIAPMIGAVLYTQVSMNWIFLFNVISFFIAAALESVLVFDSAPISQKKERVLASLKIVQAYLKENKALKHLLYLAIAMQVLFEPMSRLVLPFITYDILKVSSFQFGTIQTCSSIGVVIASLLVSRKKDPKVFFRHFFLLLSAQGFLFALWAFPAMVPQEQRSAWSITIGFIILQILGRIVNGVQNIPMFSYFQLHIPEEIRGRVIGFILSIASLLAPLSIFLTGVLIKRDDWYWVPVVIGGCYMLFALIASRDHTLKAFIMGSKS